MKNNGLIPRARCWGFVLAACFLVSPASSSEAGDSSNDLIAVKISRSIFAEASLVIELERNGRVTRIFANALLQQARDQLESVEPQLAQDENALGLVHGGLAEISAGNLSGLRGIIDQLVALESAHESP